MKKFKTLSCLLTFIVTASAASGATLTVTNTNDNGAGSLRQALVGAVSGDTIDFDLPAPAVINLTSGELLINRSLTIEGPGAKILTINLSGGVAGDSIPTIEIGSGELDVTVKGLTLSHGPTSPEGSGFLNGSSGAVTVEDCVVSNNFNLAGGGIENRGTMNLFRCTVADNAIGDLAEQGGGGILNNGTMMISGCTIANNQAEGGAGGPPLPQGAGIYNHGALTITNSTISGNSVVKGYGGGIANVQGTITLLACTISNNNGSSGGGGIYRLADNVSGEIQIKDSIIAGNVVGGDTPPFQTPNDIMGVITSQGYNLIGTNQGASFNRSTGDQIGSAGSPIDPLLGPLQDNGGPTETQALRPGSLAIDQGKGFGLTTDQRGRFRPVDAPAIDPAQEGDNSDIGAWEKQAAQPLNISTRANVLTGDNILDGGFIVTGTAPKRVIIRGLGPSLGEEMVSGFLVNPTLELHDSDGAVLSVNDDWKDTQEAEIEATGIAPRDDAEAAIVTTLDPGTYTVILAGKSGGTGIGLVEVYDLDTAVVSTLGNTSTRGFVGAKDDVMISGFILGAGEGLMDRILVRGLGPSLAQSGITDVLMDPSLELHDGNGALIASDDDWQDTQKSEIEATGLAPTDASEAALLEELPPGNYTTIVRGAESTTGISLLEIYDLH